jgi:cellulose synthase/poly-beta-1,6-N-acetylglucosamine synthase-like glycosyltransferase
MSELLFWIFITISLINTAHFGMYLVGANYYDVLRFRKDALPKKRSRTPKPLVSVVIAAHNEEFTIARTLDSVRKSSYRKLEIIIVDDGSTDNTKKVVREYIKKYPKANIKLMYKQKNVGKGQALNHGMRNGAKGELIMTLDADSLLGKKSVAHAVEYFDDPSVMGVAANVQVIDSQSVLGLLQRFEYMVGYRSKKFFTVTNCEFIVGGVASTYRASTLKDVGFYDDDIITEDIALSLKVISQGNKENRVVYGVNVLARTEGVLTFKALLKQRYRWKMGNLQSIIKYRHLTGDISGKHSIMLTWYRFPMAFLGELIVLLEPLVLAYVLYICLQLASLSFIIGAYVFITVYLLWNLLPDEHMSTREKLRMSGYAPVMYFIMYLMNIVQIVAIVRCIINYRQVTRKVKTHSTWKSPTRAAQHAIS